MIDSALARVQERSHFYALILTLRCLHATLYIFVPPRVSHFITYFLESDVPYEAALLCFFARLTALICFRDILDTRVYLCLKA